MPLADAVGLWGSYGDDTAEKWRAAFKKSHLDPTDATAST